MEKSEIAKRQCAASRRQILPSCREMQIFITVSGHMRAWMGKHLPKPCGIEVKGDNKWITLIQNASQKWRCQIKIYLFFLLPTTSF